MLRLLTYLAPSLPIGLFEAIARRIERASGLATRVSSEARWSGPPRGRPDPFSTGRADVGFLCSPAWLWLREAAPPPVELAPFALAPLDPRAGGRAVYFSDVIVRADDRARGFDDCAGRAWAYNDTCSMSGYFCLLEKLADRERGGDFFGRVVEAGSHLAAIDLVASGGADAAAIDSNVLALARAREPRLAARLRTIESWGPFPIQPIVLRRGLAPSVKRAIAGALAEPGDDLAPFGFAGFAPVDDAHYLAEARALAACQRLRLRAAG